MAVDDRQLRLSPPAADDSRPRAAVVWLRAIARVFGFLCLGSLLVAALVSPVRDPVRAFLRIRVAPAVAPGTASMAAAIALNNIREAAIPFLCLALRTRRAPWLVRVGDVVVWSCVLVNVALGGLALGAYGLRLLAYLPQWPFEWGGLAVALAAWTQARRGPREPCELVLLAILAALLLCGGALLESFATPQV